MENQFKGSKGKWEMVVSYDESYEQPIINIGAKDDSLVSFVTIWSGVDRGYEIPNEMKANALLISKAPEMLEMLIALKDKLGIVYYEKEISEIENLIKSATTL